MSGWSTLEVHTCVDLCGYTVPDMLGFGEMRELTDWLLGHLTMDKGDILHSIYTRRLDEDTKVDDVLSGRLREYGISRGDSRRGRLRGSSRKVYNQRATGSISVHTL